MTKSLCLTLIFWILLLQESSINIFFFQLFFCVCGWVFYFFFFNVASNSFSIFYFYLFMIHALLLEIPGPCGFLIPGKVISRSGMGDLLKNRPSDLPFVYLKQTSFLRHACLLSVFPCDEFTADYSWYITVCIYVAYCMNRFFYFKSLDLKSESYLTEIITSIALY